MNKNRFYEISKLFLIILLGIGFSIHTAKANHADDFEEKRQAKLLIDVLEEISTKYQVFFSYELTLLEEIKVEFEFKAEESLDQAISRLMVKTNLQYDSFNEKYFVIYENSKKAKKDSRKVIKKFKQIERLQRRGTIKVQQTQTQQTKQMASVVEAVIALKEEKIITGTITDTNGELLIGATVLVKSTSIGTTTDFNGTYSISAPDDATTLVISYIGYAEQEIAIGGRTVIDVQLLESAAQLEEVVVVGYGSFKKSDLTGSVLRADIEAFEEQPNISIIQSLQGSVPGLNVGQVDAAGESPEILIRGRTSISGQQNPLIVLDGTIFRGQLIDINPSDIASVDVLKDASSTAVYGSQAANGVILVTTKSGKSAQKTTINYTTSYTVQSAIKALKPGDGADYIQHIIDGDITDSHTASSGFLQLNPDYNPTTRFKTGDMITAFNAGQQTNWYDLLTNENPYINTHNLSLSHRNEHVAAFASVGYTEQVGNQVGEEYKRWNVRLNLDNYVTNWLTVGIQTFATSSDFSGLDIDRNLRYLPPYALDRDETGAITVQPGGLSTNPLRFIEEADHKDTRLNLFGNIFAKIDVPFVEGLSYKINYSTNYSIGKEFIFRPYGQNFQGAGSKFVAFDRSYSSDNVLTYNRALTEDHKITATLLYGFEKLNGDATLSGSSLFLNDALGYNQLEAGQSDLQTAASSGYEEASLYSMARLFYGFQGKYLLTGTIRRDGFSGFGVRNKFGTFPSASAAWVLSRESFLSDLTDITFLKLRGAYGVSGNRTIGRYATLATVSGAFNYVDADGNAQFGQSISSLANPNLKWETTTGLNLGVDYALFNSRVSGSIDFYSNETEDVLYEVNLPQIARFSSIPVNLGKLKNSGIDLMISTINIQREDLTWTSTFNFSRNRDELVELLGFDNDGDGIEDDIIDAGLFIGQPLSTIYDYEITGNLYQLEDELPSGFDIGAHQLKDLDGDGDFTPDDRTIIGYQEPSYRFSIQNEVRYRGFTLRVFLNSVQGGNNYYLGEDMLTSWNAINSETVFDRNFPAGADYWTPENPDAKYQKLFINVSGGLQGTRYTARSFVRLQDVSLSYTFPSSIMERLKIANLKLYVSAKNLTTWTKFPGWDPETGSGLTRGGRPVLKGYSFGLNVSF